MQVNIDFTLIFFSRLSSLRKTFHILKNPMFMCIPFHIFHKLHFRYHYGNFWFRFLLSFRILNIWLIALWTYITLRSAKRLIMNDFIFSIEVLKYLILYIKVSFSNSIIYNCNVNAFSITHKIYFDIFFQIGMYLIEKIIIK